MHFVEPCSVTKSDKSTKLRENFRASGKSLKRPATAPSELHVLEHLKHGVNHGRHDHVALHQPAIVISDFCLVQPI